MHRAPLCAVAAVVAAAFAGPLSIGAQTQTCDRACLSGMVTQFLNSLVAHDPKVVPLADTVKYTEDASVKAVGDGFWKTATKTRAYRTDFLDVRQGTAAV